MGSVVASEIVAPLLAWFSNNKRDLPWRQTYDPYHIWISEIMLQQTQMDRGIHYFKNWIEKFPDVNAIANSSEEEILKSWEGLGYYARAKNLHKAAKVMADDFSGIVPCDYNTLLSFPGIGQYTAAAIASIAGNSDIAVIDANVCRVYSRIFDIAILIKSKEAQKKLQKIANQLLPSGNARKFNQAIMEFGGLICTPKKPKCNSCPIFQNCKAFTRGTVEVRPIQAQKKPTVVQYRVAGYIKWQDRVFIQKRPRNGLWAGLWEFPGGEVERVHASGIDFILVSKTITEDCGLPVEVEKLITTVKHQYTHHKVTQLCYLATLNPNETKPSLKNAIEYRWVKVQDLGEYAFPAGPRMLIEHMLQGS